MIGGEVIGSQLVVVLAAVNGGAMGNGEMGGRGGAKMRPD